MSLFYGYVDEIDELKTSVYKKLSLSGGKMKGDIDMSLWRIKNIPAPIYDYDAISKAVLEQTYLVDYKKIVYYRKSLSETMMWEYYTKYATGMYRFDRGLSNSELVFDTTTRKVSETIDQGLEENDAVQNTANLQPLLCTKSEKVGNRYFLKFDGTQRLISDINLNAVSGAKVIVNVFIVYRIKAYDANNYQVRNGLFDHDYRGYDKFVSFGPSGDLIITETTNDYIVIGSNSVLRR